MPLSQDVKERIEFVASYVQGSLTDWFLLKQVILRAFPGQIRKQAGLSKRNNSTKKMVINDADLEVMAYWELLTGVKVVIDPKRLHDPEWISRPRGWALNGGKQKELEKEVGRKKT
jgi:hypothetical protein